MDPTQPPSSEPTEPTELPPQTPPDEPQVLHADLPRAPRSTPGAAGGERVRVVLAVAVVGVVGLGAFLLWRAESKINKVALAESPKPVTVTVARASAFQPSRKYVGTLEPWLAASVGSQLISAYVDTVLVRPGASVKRGEVLATLDCRDASAASQAVASSARAIDARQKALASESARLATLLQGHFVSPNEVEQKTALTQAEAAELASMRAKLARNTLEVGDCVLRAPFDGEVASRTIDPGAFVRPGLPLVSVVDRSTVRLVVDAPEIDFDALEPGTKVRVALTATRREVVGAISRRAPAADPSTRTVHFEVDLPDAERVIPVGTTGEALIDVGKPVAATELPLFAATIRGKKATVFVVEAGVAHARTFPITGEVGGSLFVGTELPAGAQVVTEGRASLGDGDRVAAKEEAATSASTAKEASP